MNKKILSTLAIAIGLLLVAMGYQHYYKLQKPQKNDSSSQGSIQFNCSGNAASDTQVVINSPSPNSTITSGTELNWERTGHDICGNFGTNKRYSVAICGFSTVGACNPANGLYFANISPDDLDWEQADPGVFTLSAEDIETIQDKSGVTDGGAVSFQIRYNYTNFSTQYGPWDTRTFLLDLDGTPPAPPEDRPVLINIPATEMLSPSQAISFIWQWQAVANATFYKAKLAYRMGDPSGSDMGDLIRVSEERIVTEPNVNFPEALPSNTSLVVISVAACNAGGCSNPTIQGVFVNPPAPAVTANFSTIISAFRAPSCVNCHAVAANNFQNQPAAGYETGSNFGLPPNHPAGANCVSCHSANLTPEGSHPVPWQAAPVEMDLRNKTDLELCQMAQDPGSLAENIEDHLLGDPLILWAVEAGELPLGAGATDDAFVGNWAAAVIAWIEAGASCE